MQQQDAKMDYLKFIYCSAVMQLIKGRHQVCVFVLPEQHEAMEQAGRVCMCVCVCVCVQIEVL